MRAEGGPSAISETRKNSVGDTIDETLREQTLDGPKKKISLLY